MDKLKEFLIKNKLIIGGVTGGVATIAIMLVVFSPYLGFKAPDIEHSNKVEDVYKYSEGLVNVLKIETGSKVPEYTTYFNDSKNITETYEVKYFLKDKELTIDEVSIEINGERYLTGTNTYQIKLVKGQEELLTNLNVVDTTKPAVVLKTLNVYYGEKYDPKDFVNQYDDNSRDYKFTVKLKEEKDNVIKESGPHTVNIYICDSSNNCTEQRATVIVGDKSQTLETTKEEKIKIKSEDIKYGVKRITFVRVLYNVYKDGSTEEVSRGKEETEIDQSGFNGKTLEMKAEAILAYDGLEKTRTDILNKTNTYRRNHKLNNLVLDKDLSIIATIRAMELAYSGKFNHVRPNGTDWTTIWDEYTGLERKVAMGENLAYRYTTDIEVVEEWYKSKSHKAIMLESRYTKIGIGKFTFNGETYWVQHFSE